MPDRILVVDDEEAIREIVSSMLTSAGYSCKQARSGMEALAVLNSGEAFELLLSDLMMAELDGSPSPWPPSATALTTICSSPLNASNCWPRSAGPWKIDA